MNTKKMDGGGQESVYLSDIQRTKVKILIDKGFYENVSQLVRAAIDREYKLRIPDSRAELISLKKKQEEIVAALESTVEPLESFDNVMKEYILHGTRMSKRARMNYDSISKKWIETRQHKLEQYDIGKTVEEIYANMEKLKEGYNDKQARSG